MAPLAIAFLVYTRKHKSFNDFVTDVGKGTNALKSRFIDFLKLHHQHFSDTLY
jgi:hypothetical protein